jgi:hypothetical protein
MLSQQRFVRQKMRFSSSFLFDSKCTNTRKTTKNNANVIQNNKKGQHTCLPSLGET